MGPRQGDTELPFVWIQQKISHFLAISNLKTNTDTLRYAKFFLPQRISWKNWSGNARP
jgi:hypothetical protein